MMRKMMLLGGVATLCAFAMSSAQAAPPTNLITNGDFETGTTAGWTIVTGGGGGVQINNGSFDPPGPGGPLPPISGRYDAVTYQLGGGAQGLQQAINVPADVFSASLTWNDRLRNYASIYDNTNQVFRVVIRDTVGHLLYTVFTTNPGDPLLQVGPNSRFGGLTAVLQQYAGTTIVVSFEAQVNLYFFNVTLDDVKLLVSFLPKSKDECKDSGWSTFVNVETGKQIFKNQGDCVSFVATKGKNPPSGPFQP